MSGEPAHPPTTAVPHIIEVPEINGAADAEPAAVRAVLDEIGAEETTARLEARVAGLEQELGRFVARAVDAERAHRGELELMRTRIDEAIEAVRATLDEQRAAWSALEERLAGAAPAPAAGDGSDRVAALEERLAAVETDVLTRVDRLDRRVRTLAAAVVELRGDVGAGASPVDPQRVGRLEEAASLVRQQLASLGASLNRTATQVRQLAATTGDQDPSTREPDGLREEVRDLAVRTAELAARLADVERTSRATNELIEEAIRRTRDPGTAAAPRADADGPALRGSGSP